MKNPKLTCDDPTCPNNTSTLTLQNIPKDKLKGLSPGKLVSVDPVKPEIDVHPVYLISKNPNKYIIWSERDDNQ